MNVLIDYIFILLDTMKRVRTKWNPSSRSELMVRLKNTLRHFLDVPNAAFWRGISLNATFSTMHSRFFDTRRFSTSPQYSGINVWIVSFFRCAVNLKTATGKIRSWFTRAEERERDLARNTCSKLDDRLCLGFFPW